MAQDPLRNDTSPLRWALPALALVLALAVGGYALSAHLLRQQARAQAEAMLDIAARQLADAAAARWTGYRVFPGSMPCPEWPGLRLAITLPDGASACVSATAELPALPAQADAVRAAWAGRAGAGWHREREGPDYRVATYPVRVAGQVVAVLQAARRLEPPVATLATLRRGYLWGGGAALALLALLVLAARRALGRRVGSLIGALERMAREEPPPGAAQPGDPARDEALPTPLRSALQQAASRWRVRVGELRRRLDEREAVLASMGEGVLAVDAGGHVIELNRAAAAMFAVDAAAAPGRSLIEIVRNPELLRFVGESQGSPEPLERELTLPGPPPRVLQVHATALRDGRGRGLGLLVVLGDVTRLRALEDMRREFVANVSHELKTPITSIKGFVETLLDGAWKEPEHARRFLEIVARHADRLNAITDDLLQLSHIEQEAEQGALATEAQSVAAVLQEAIQVCAVKAAERGIQVELDCPPGLQARINAPLIEQAVVNLVDNALKYAPPHTRVRVEGAALPSAAPGGDGASQPGIAIRVRDEGPGISAVHLPRLFERFYRVDKARSREAGGTGLGLAIVKHIAQAHGGQATVESRLGAGSTFTLRLPGTAPLA